MHHYDTNRYNRSGEGGMALVLVLVFTAALMVYGTALLTYAFNEKQIAAYYCQDPAKHYLAESGLEAGLAALHKDFYYDREIRGSLDEGTFTVSFADDTEYRRLIISEGLFEDYSLVLTAVVEYDPENGPVIVEWQAPY